MAGKTFTIPFASAGDRAGIPDAVQPDGSVSFSAGFTFDYERPNTDPSYKPVPRDQTNEFYYLVTQAVGIIQKQGAADWDATATPYVINSQVRHVDKLWRSNIANNNDEPGTTGAWDEDRTSQEQGLAVFSTAGVSNWTVPDELKSGRRKATVTVIGAGGGASRFSNGGGGGGGGGISKALVDLTGLSTVTVTVGAAGTGRTGSAGPGTAGGASGFGGLVTATGGLGGDQWKGGSGGAGATAGGVNSSLGGGSSCVRHDNPGSVSKYGGGNGGGPGGSGSASGDLGASGSSATLPGGGGGAGNENGNGGNGAAGQVIVEW
jgi:hypothetical protein